LVDFDFILIMDQISSEWNIWLELCGGLGYHWTWKETIAYVA
jgi:hypothetical protein